MLLAQHIGFRRNPRLFRPGITAVSMILSLFAGSILGYSCEVDDQVRMMLPSETAFSHNAKIPTCSHDNQRFGWAFFATPASDHPTNSFAEPKSELAPVKHKPNELFPIEVDGLYGYINLKGKVVIEPQYAMAHYFSDDVALVQLPDRSYGFINTSGELVISNKKEVPDEVRTEYGEFSEGLAPFKNKAGKWGFINLKGEVVIPAEYLGARPFKGGFSVVNLKAPDEWRIGDRTYIDKTGKRISNAVFQEANDFSDGLGAVNMAGVHGNWGFIDSKGKFVIEPQFHHAYSFYHGLARAMPKGGGGYGYINKSGKYVLGVHNKSEQKKVGGLTIDVREQAFGAFSCFHEGIAPLYEDGGWYIYSSNGKRLTKQLKYHGIEPFFEGMAAYYEKRDDLKVGIINSKGAVVAKPQFNVFNNYKNGLAFAKDDHHQMYLNKEGKVVWKSPLKK